MFKTLDIRSKYGFWRLPADTGSPTPAYELLGQATTPDRCRGQAFGDRLGRPALQVCHFYGSLYYNEKFKIFNKKRTF